MSRVRKKEIRVEQIVGLFVCYVPEYAKKSPQLKLNSKPLTLQITAVPSCHGGHIYSHNTIQKYLIRIYYVTYVHYVVHTRCDDSSTLRGVSKVPRHVGGIYRGALSQLLFISC